MKPRSIILAVLVITAVLALFLFKFTRCPSIDGLSAAQTNLENLASHLAVNLLDYPRPITSESNLEPYFDWIQSSHHPEMQFGSIQYDHAKRAYFDEFGNQIVWKLDEIGVNRYRLTGNSVGTNQTRDGGADDIIVSREIFRPNTGHVPR